MNTPRLTTCSILCTLALGCSTAPWSASWKYDGAAARVAPKHVIMIGWDGFAGNAVNAARAPVLKKLMAEGAWTLHSRSILPSASACCWHSIFTCSAPEQHGFNAWNSQKPVFAPSAICDNGKYPDITYLLRSQRPDAEIGFIYDWPGMGFVTDTNACNYARRLPVTNLTAAAIAYIRERKPTFFSVCYDSPDDRGHRFGWGSPEYLARVTELDTQLGQILEALRAANMADDTVVMITSDHGGLQKKHGGATLSEMERPVVLWGKGVKRGHELEFAGTNYDTGATLAALLGLHPPQCWIGRPFDEAFQAAD